MAKKSRFHRKNQPTLLPYFVVDSVEDSVTFYQNAFKFKLCDTIRNDNGMMTHADLMYETMCLMIAHPSLFDSGVLPPKQQQTPSGMMLYLYCKKVDDFYEQALANGAMSSAEPYDTYWQDRVCQLRDINGYEWYFASPLVKKRP